MRFRRKPKPGRPFILIQDRGLAGPLERNCCILISTGEAVGVGKGGPEGLVDVGTGGDFEVGDGFFGAIEGNESALECGAEEFGVETYGLLVVVQVEERVGGEELEQQEKAHRHLGSGYKVRDQHGTKKRSTQYPRGGEFDFWPEPLYQDGGRSV